MSDTADVIVTDGFTGNVVLKTLEGRPARRSSTPCCWRSDRRPNTSSTPTR